MKKLYESIGSHIEKVNEEYKDEANKIRKSVEYQLGHLVWLQLRKEMFLTRRKR